MANKFRVVPLPGALPLVGHVHQFRHGFLDYLVAAPRHGDLAELRIGPARVLLVCTAGLAHEVLRSGQEFDKGGQFFERAKEVVGNSLTTCTHDEHRRQRRLVQPAFSKERVAGYTGQLNEEIAAMMGRWRPGSTLDITAETNGLAARMLASTVLHRYPISAAELTTVLADVDTLVAVAAKRMLLPAVLNKLPTAGNRRYEAASARLRALMTRAARATGGEAAAGADLLSILLATRDGGSGLSETEVVDQLVLFQIAGIDTTANALAWAVWLISEHPQVQQQLQAEADTVLGEEAAAGHQHLPDLVYTRQVVDETLRLYPPVWVLTRTAMRDTELDGHPVEAGTTLMISPYLLHRQPGNYPSPDEFKPGRWEPQPARAGGSFIPFGLGARRCIGEHFAYAEMVLALAALARNWQFQPGPALAAKPPKPQLAASLRPPALPIIVGSRQR